MNNTKIASEILKIAKNLTANDVEVELHLLEMSKDQIHVVLKFKSYFDRPSGLYVYHVLGAAEKALKAATSSPINHDRKFDIQGEHPTLKGVFLDCQEQYCQVTISADFFGTEAEVKTILAKMGYSN